ncbi:hypothetical protein [Synechococcus phage MA10]|uniref:Uncharacterized protein n=1 Tax=Synechococcus phage S-H34 TaxID=2718942 RepID=A0A6G8R6I5_9CAUD|nr:hypothetical protein PQC15_gp122 [Synechococcus phage S-H34]QIN96993.1 hypothetical protein [Synechococcus phage S-H34]
MALYNYVQALADKIQETWNDDQRLFYRNLENTAPNEDTRANCRKVLQYMAEGLHDYRQNYRVKENEGTYQVVYNCCVSGLPMVHCVVNAETGDLAQYTTDLVDRVYHQYNLLDPRSREACMAVANFSGDYLT